MRSRLARLGDALSLCGLAVVAGGGTAFFAFARVLFDRVPAFSEHPRFDAGEVVGPIVHAANATEIAVALLVLAVARLRRSSADVSPRANSTLVFVAAGLLAVALAERFFLLPQIVDLRARLGRGGFDAGVSSPERSRFGLLHGIDNLAQLAAVLLAYAGLLLERAATTRRA
ncbi:MAG TPA: DUF4149 domain-containing protein [Planctomycetota bacterium]|nr:DUF4149 domain-containing protein [Planctomycetota bacterium]